MNSLKALRIYVYGRVQRIGFRRYVANLAQEMVKRICKKPIQRICRNTCSRQRRRAEKVYGND